MTSSSAFGSTPFKPGSPFTFSSTFVHNVQEIEDAVKLDVGRYCYADIDTKIFFNTFLSGTGQHGGTIQAVVDHVFAQLQNGSQTSKAKLKPLYANGHWVNIPTHPVDENALYEPFLEALRAITSACYDHPGVRANLGDGHFRVDWSAPFRTSVTSEDQTVHKPDIVAAVSGWDIAPTDKAWWRVIQTVVEVKKKGGKDHAIVQMLRYARQCLISQQDRRFLYSFVLAGKYLQVWHVDRSGALSPEQIDIHADPKLFVQAVVALLLKDPLLLGWDTSMRIFKSIDKKKLREVKSISSWEDKIPKGAAAKTAEKRAELPYKRQWLVTAGENRFVMFSAITFTRAQIIRGRATRVWRAWKLDDMMKFEKDEDRPIYVIKDCWREEPRGLEGELYEPLRGVDGVASAEWYGAVYLGADGKKDDTLNLIRQGVKPGPKSTPIQLGALASANRPIVHKYPDERNIESNTVEYWRGEMFIHIDDEPPFIRNRVHSRLIMSDYGCTIPHFTTMLELLTAFRDALAGAMNIYEKGVLHRDISAYNILISANPRPNNAGILIDLDYAIKWETHETYVEDWRTGTPMFASCEVLKGQIVSLDAKAGPSLNDVDALMPGPEEEEEDFNTAKRRRRTEERPKFYQTLSHDLESFFWVLMWLCICRAGPARARDFGRNSKDFSEDVPKRVVAEQVKSVFETLDWTSLGRNKEAILREDEDWMTLKECMHPYFLPLAKLVESLRLLVRVLLMSQNRDIEKVKEVGRKMLQCVDQWIAYAPIRSYDDEGKHGGSQEYESSRKAERARREEEGWYPNEAEPAYIVSPNPIPLETAADLSAKRGYQQRVRSDSDEDPFTTGRRLRQQPAHPH